MIKGANVICLIDLQNCFGIDGLTEDDGGSLYVPDGEAVAIPAAEIIRAARNTTFILSQDFHPRDQIAFAVNHKGKKPYDVINLKSENGVCCVVDSDEIGSFKQTLWPTHGVQGTKSCLFFAPVMEALPLRLRQDLEAHKPDLMLTGNDNRGNVFYVIRKGTRQDLDSNAIATGNDGVSLTCAPSLFAAIADDFAKKNIETVRVFIGGLATNFCLELSHNDLYVHFVPALKEAGIQTQVYYLNEISKGIPISTPDGFWPDLANSPKRMQRYGTSLCTLLELKTFLKNG